MKFIDKYFWWSLGVSGFIGVIFWLIYKYGFSAGDKTAFNNVSYIGTYLSIIGLLITVIQLLKISSNSTIYKETFSKAIALIKGNEYISVITSANEQIIVIKKLFELEKFENSVSNHNSLFIYLNKLSKLEQAKNYTNELERVKEILAKSELKISMKEPFEKPELKELYGDLIKLQAILSELESILKTPNS